MKKLSCFLLLCFAIHANAATSITTPSVSGHWTLAGSPYNIYNDIQVDGTQSLTIDPGVNVIFYGSYRMIVNGILQAVGTASLPVNFMVADTTGFTTDNYSAAGGWHGIQFLAYGGAVTDISTLQYCNISFTKFDSADYFTSPELHSLFIQRSLTINNCSFFNNRTNSQYSVDLFAISTNSGQTAELGTCNFYSNFSGAAVFLNFNKFGGNTFIHDCKIYQNQAQTSVFSTYWTNLLFQNNEVFQNAIFGTISGIGILTIDGNATLKGNNIHDNICQKDGAVFCEGGFVDIIGNEICNNQHTSGICGVADGGGALNLCWNSGISHANTFYNVRNNIIANNYSPFQGGGIKLMNAGATITNNQIVNNKSTGGAAIHIFDNDTSSFVIKNNLFYGNIKDTSVFTSPVIDAILYSSSLEYDHNWAQCPTAFELNLSGMGFTFSGDTTTNIVGTDPGMIAPTMTAGVASGTMTAKFGLLSTSPCVDKGDTTGIIIEPVDYAGSPRINGSLVDIGAYEYCPSCALSEIFTAVSEKQLQVFPNPAHNQLYVSVPEAKGTLVMLDISGRRVMQTNVTSTLTSFDIHSIDRGLYFIVLDDGSNSRTIQKIVVE